MQRQALQAGTGLHLAHGLRPEHLAFAAAGLPGQLTMIEPTGPETRVKVAAAVGQRTARVPGSVGTAWLMRGVWLGPLKKRTCSTVPAACAWPEIRLDIGGLLPAATAEARAGHWLNSWA